MSTCYLIHSYIVSYLYLESAISQILQLSSVFPSIAYVVIDGYTHNSGLTSGDSVPLGTQRILVCHVVGLPYGTPHNYSWTCPNGPCEVEGYYGRKIYNEHVLAVNTTSTSDAGTYTCQVTATGGNINKANFSLGVDGKQEMKLTKRLLSCYPVCIIIFVVQVLEFMCLANNC